MLLIGSRNTRSRIVDWVGMDGEVIMEARKSWEMRSTGRKRSWEIRSTRRKERISEENFMITSFQTHSRDEKFTKR